jgi:hypothetical protein
MLARSGGQRQGAAARAWQIFAAEFSDPLRNILRNIPRRERRLAEAFA